MLQMLVTQNMYWIYEGELNLSEETIPSLKKLYEKKSSLQLSLNAYKDVLSDCKSQVHELDVVRQNVDSILNHQTPEYFKTSEQVL